MGQDFLDLQCSNSHAFQDIFINIQIIQFESVLWPRFFADPDTVLF